MTRPLKKERERVFAEVTARLLGKVWRLGIDREHPDFLVAEDGSQFGLEVAELFVGRQGKSGSALKAQESFTQRSINDLQRQYEAVVNVPLTVKFVGSMKPENLATVVAALMAQDLQSKPKGYHFVHDTTVQYTAIAMLRVHVTKGHRNWYCVNDRVGFVDRNPRQAIVNAIENKAKELARYQSAVGNDVRLLLVADHLSKSGKLRLESPGQFALLGFKAVYLLMYPEAAVVLNDAHARDSWAAYVSGPLFVRL